MFLRLCLALVLLTTLLTTPARAIINGSIAVGSDYVVTILVGDTNPQGYCTGAYLRPRVVVTAAHCVIKAGAKAPEPAISADSFFVSQAGIDWTTPEAKETRVKVLKFWTTPDYFNRWEPERGLKETQVDDIAFLFLEKELSGVPLSRAATRNEIEEFRNGNQDAFHLGYGCINSAENRVVGNDGRPRRVDGIVGTQRQESHIPNRDRFLNITYPAGKSLCPGDSGSPLLMKKGDEVLYLATLFAGGGWNEITAGNLSLRGDGSATVLWPYLADLDKEWSKFLQEEQEIREAELAKKLEAEREELKLAESRRAAVAKNTFYKDTSSCHGRGISAELQELSQGTWKSVSAALGWDDAPNCPSSHPVQPWTIAEVPQGTTLRWRFWIPGQFDVNSNQFASLVMVSPTPTPTPSVAPRSEVRSIAKTTIICTKGRIIKKVRTTNSKCPKGFRRR